MIEFVLNPKEVSKLFLCLMLTFVVHASAQEGAQQAAQSIPAQALTQNVPEWQKEAGGKIEFDVASVREDRSGRYVTPPFSIDSDDDYSPTGGIFNAIASLQTYISFAYKLDQQYSMLTNLPKWASTTHFAIRAQVDGNPTKDQMRLMMQALLADRFKLKIHFEARERPALALSLIRPGVLGPKLRLHADGPACDVVVPYPGPSSPTASVDMFPCNVYMAISRPDHAILAGARNTTVRLMAAFFSSVGHLDRPVVDQTGLNGKIDFAMEYTPDQPGSFSRGVELQPDPQGETFLEAMKDQLGLRLKPTTAKLDIPVVDHVEMPSAN